MSRSMPHAEVDAHGNAGVSAGSSTWMVDEFKAAQRFNEHLIAELRHLKEHLGIPQKSPMGSATPGSASAAGAPAPALPLAIPLD